MKKNYLRALCRLFVSSAILLPVAPLGAQVSDPSAWTEFVESSDMPQIIDTFRMQTFSQSDKDNWTYTLSGGAALSEEENAMKIPLEGRIDLDPYSLVEYQRVSVGVVCYSQSIVAGDSLYVKMDNKKGNNRIGAIFPFKGANTKTLIKLASTPNNIALYALNKKTGTSDGYFLIDSIFATDTTSCYSLFTGSGNWTDNDCWSSLAPYRRRGALIVGDVEVNTSVGCGLISISDGSLTITEEGELTTDTLCMHDTDFSISSAGKFTVEKIATIYHTFPEKGKWYFLSFPFDVSLDGIDSRFTLEDDQFEGSGNYLYVQTYDGDKRTATQTATGNWTTFAVATSSDNPIVFERGKGYLVALDEAAEYTTLTFSATEGNIPANFGASASIPVEVATSASNDKSGNNGWYLCGNPLPAPLSLSRISSNTALDGYIYIYNNGEYTPYDINGNYELPPLAAFFVKASAETMLSITDEQPATKAALLRTDSPLSADAAEPRSVATGILEVIGKDASMDMSLEGNVLHLFGLPSSGRLQAIDTAGRVVYSCSLPQGASACSLPLRDGVYILVIEAENYTRRQKFSIHF